LYGQQRAIHSEDFGASCVAFKKYEKNALKLKENKMLFMHV
jgi:hypothetical protein